MHLPKEEVVLNAAQKLELHLGLLVSWLLVVGGVISKPSVLPNKVVLLDMARWRELCLNLSGKLIAWLPRAARFPVGGPGSRVAASIRKSLLTKPSVCLLKISTDQPLKSRSNRAGEP
jgi:hypothetical protein